MDVTLSFTARQQFDKGGRFATAIEKATAVLGADALPKEAAKLSRQDAIEEGLVDEEEQADEDKARGDEQEDDDDRAARDDRYNLWVIAIGETNVYFEQPTVDHPARLILRAV